MKNLIFRTISALLAFFTFSSGAAAVTQTKAAQSEINSNYYIQNEQEMTAGVLPEETYLYEERTTDNFDEPLTVITKETDLQYYLSIEIKAKNYSLIEALSRSVTLNIINLYSNKLFWDEINNNNIFEYYLEAVTPVIKMTSFFNESVFTKMIDILSESISNEKQIIDYNEKLIHLTKIIMNFRDLPLQNRGNILSEYNSIEYDYYKFTDLTGYDEQLKNEDYLGIIFSKMRELITEYEQNESDYIIGFLQHLEEKYESVIIDVPFISQTEKYPTGCESVSAVMLLHYIGIDISVESFIDNYLSKCFKPFSINNKDYYSGDPNKYFMGNPYKSSGWGCYPDVIADALERLKTAEKHEFSYKKVEGEPLENLCREYIDKGIPVAIWATQGMQPAKEGKLLNIIFSDSVFQWISPMHCLVMVGYDENNFYFNDPQECKNMAYNKEDTDKAYNDLGENALIIN